MSDDYVSAGYLVEEPEQENPKNKQNNVDAHEKFMREASKQMVDNLTQIKKDIHTMANWVLFFGVIAIFGAILGGCNVLMAFF